MADETAVVEVGDAEFAAAVAQGVVVVDVGAEWCPPCRAMKPVLEDLAQELAGQVKVVTVDAEKAAGVARQLNVQAMPTFLLFRDGVVAGRAVGAMGKRVLRERLGF
jgi:thioredoxin